MSPKLVSGQLCGRQFQLCCGFAFDFLTAIFGECLSTMFKKHAEKPTQTYGSIYTTYILDFVCLVFADWALWGFSRC